MAREFGLHPLAVVDGLENDIDEIETEVFSGKGGVSRRIYQLSREVIQFQRATEPLPGILDDLVGHAGDPELPMYLRNVQDHALRITEHVGSFRELLQNILSVNLTLVGISQNEEVKGLTQASIAQADEVKMISAWAAILFAPTLVGAVYGMNFDHMPELYWTLGYPFALALMLVVSASLYLAFKRRGWLWRPPKGSICVRDVTAPGCWYIYRKSGPISEGRLVMAGFVEGIFLSPAAGAQMEGVQAVTALEGCGLEDDRYCAGTGHWSRFGRACEVTFIAAEDLDDIERETGVGVKSGEHRRNVVTRGASLKALRRGERFRAGEVVFEYRGPRSVCRYVERLTEPGMTGALKGRGGVCAKVIENGTLRVGDEIEVLQPTR